jgi:glycosyltransferase involved in cell wall biosynthesis
MMKFGSVGVFYILTRKPNDQTIPGVDPQDHYNLVEPQLSFWEKLELRFWWLHPRKFSRTIGRYTKAAAQELERVLAEFQPDLVLADIRAYEYAPIIKRYGCRFILEEQNVEVIVREGHYSAYYLLENRKLTIKEKIERSLDLSRTKLAERDLLDQADQVWICSDVDDKLLQDLYGQVSHTRMLPNGIDVTHYDTVRLGQCTLPQGLEKKQRYLLYSGQFTYPPNVQSVEMLIDQIYPRLRQVYPDCRLLVVGHSPTQQMLEAAQRDSGIIVTGEVPDVRPYLAAASVMVVPLRHGSGTRLKILEAFAAGCPVVSTAKGAEGLKAKDGEHLLIRDEIEAIIEGVCQLWSDPSLGQKLANSAYELVKAEYSWSVIGQKVESAIQELF